MNVFESEEEANVRPYDKNTEPDIPERSSHYHYFADKKECRVIYCFADLSVCLFSLSVSIFSQLL